MKVVVFEYVSSGLYQPESLYPSLIKEADLMVNAVGLGLTEIGCEPIVFRAPFLSPLQFDAQVIPLTEQDDWQSALEAELRRTDAYIPLAPESNDLLEHLCLKAAQTNCILLNTPPQTVRKAADKYYTLKRLQSHNIPCIACDYIDEHTFPAVADRVVKPNNSVACEHTFLIRAGDAPSAEQRQHVQIHQPYLAGVAGSLSVIYCPDFAPCILGVNRQGIIMDAHGGFKLNACHINALAHSELDFENLAVAVQECFPDLLGYVGIDFVIYDGVPYVLEINPRLTTSFAGIAKTTGVNPCAILLAAVRGEPFVCPARDTFTDYTLDLSE